MLTINIADINPIGAISKVDLKKFIAYAKDAFELPVLQGYVLSAYYQPETIPLLIDIS